MLVGMNARSCEAQGASNEKRPRRASAGVVQSQLLTNMLALNFQPSSPSGFRNFLIVSRMPAGLRCA
jgi:hypothetical protein